MAGQTLPECGEHQGTCARCGVEISTSNSKSRKRKQGEARRKRRTISIRVPNDSENGGEIWDDTEEELKIRLVQMGLYESVDSIPKYEAWVAAARDWLNMAWLS